MPLAPRAFLGWDRPALELAAEWCLTFAPDASLSTLLLVVPSGRAKRVLLALLAERAAHAQHPLALSPPTIITPGELGPALLGRRGHPAGPSARRLAWIQALRAAGPEAVATLFRHPPALDDTRALGGLSRLLEEWSAEVASTGRRLDQVPDAAANRLPDFSDEARWLAAGQIQAHYLAALARHELHDSDLSLIDRVSAQTIASTRPCHEPASTALDQDDLAPAHPRPFEHIALVALVECPPLLRAAIELTPTPVTPLVMAPPSEADAFDQLGCVDVEHWAQRSIDLSDESLFIADDPRDSARVALSCLSRLDARYSAEQIVVGVADPAVQPHLEIAARRHVGAPSEPRLEFRPSEGRPARLTPPAVLLHAVREYLATRSLSALSALVRHPDLEIRLRRDGTTPGEATPRSESWLALLDAFAARSMTDSAAAPWRGGTPAQHGALDSLRDRLHRLLGPLLDHEPREAASWAREGVDLLARVYAGRRLRRDNPVQAQIIATCDLLAQAARDLALAPPVALTAADTLEILLDALDRATLPALPSRESIEMVGWLDLALDPAPVAIVVGLNEGMVPSTPPVQAMLPERLRAVLGLSTSRSRLARDAYLLTLARHTHERLDLILARRTDDADPLLPSRLLFACDDHIAAGRLRRLVGEHPHAGAEAITPAPPDAGASPGALTPPTVWGNCPVGHEPIPESLSVTAFRDYLRAPYEFYLRHIRGAQEVEPPEPEMPPAAFGTLVHAVLARLAGLDAGASDDSRTVADALSDLLSDEARARFEPRPRTALSAQVNAARLRLADFAVHQAARAAEGWRILHTEWRADPGHASLLVDGAPIGIHGRIDRIDAHPDGRLALIDYKVGENPPGADEAHRKGRAGAKRWIDLQLPLYRHLVSDLVARSRTRAAAAEPAHPGIELLYARLGAEPDTIGFDLAPWTAQDLDDASATAHAVVRAIRQRLFHIPGAYHDSRVLRALCAAPDGRIRPPRRAQAVGDTASATGAAVEGAP